jgi:hypothetical protein
MDNVGLHHQVLVDEFSRVGVIGMDTTYLGGSEIDLFGHLIRKKFIHSALISQVKLVMGPGDDVLCIYTLSQQGTHNGTTNHATVTRHKNPGIAFRHVYFSRETGTV